MVCSYLDEDLLDFAIVDDGSVAPRTLSEAALRFPRAAHAHPSREEACTVWNEFDLLEVARIQRVAPILVLFMQALAFQQ